MPSNRLVECLDCGYRWESSAASPRCSKSDCGRSRNVEPVADDVDDDDEPDEANQDGDARPDGGGDTGRGVPGGETDDDEPENAGGYTPAFETTQTRTDTTRSTASPTDEADEADDDEEPDADGDDEQVEPASDDLPDLDPEQLVPALEATFGAAATKRGDHWELDEDEAEQLAKGWTPVINHYAPHVFQQYTEVGAALIVTYTVLGPRLAEDKRLAEQAEKAAEDTDAEGTVREPRVSDVDDEQLDLGGEEIETDSPAEQTTEDIGGYASV